MNKEKLETIFNNDLGTSYFPLLAEEYFSEGDYERANKVLDIGLLLNPTNNDGKFIKAKITMICDDSNTSVRLLKEIINADGLYVNAMKMLILHYQVTQTNQASMLKMIHKVLDLFPADKFANNILKSIKKVKTITKKKSIRTKQNRPKKQVLKTLKSTKSQSNTKTKQKTKNTEIDPKMATLTFVDILIKQNQYSQANNVLKIVKKNKSIARSSIDQRQARIKRGIAEDK